MDELLDGSEKYSTVTTPWPHFKWEVGRSNTRSKLIINHFVSPIKHDPY